MTGQISDMLPHASPKASDPYRHALTGEGRRAVEELAAWVGSP